MVPPKACLSVSWKQLPMTACVQNNTVTKSAHLEQLLVSALNVGVIIITNAVFIIFITLCSGAGYCLVDDMSSVSPQAPKANHVKFLYQHCEFLPSFRIINIIKISLSLRHIICPSEYTKKEMKEGNVLFNDALNTFYLRLYGVGHIVKDHSDSEKENLLLSHGLLFPINSKGSFICTIPQTG